MEKVDHYKAIARVSFIFTLLIGVYLIFDYFLSTSRSFISNYPYLIPLIFFGASFVLFLTAQALAKNCYMTEKEINNTQSYFTNLFDNATAGFVVTDLDGNIQDFNRKAKEILGLKDYETTNIFRLFPSISSNEIQRFAENSNEFESNPSINLGTFKFTSFDGKPVFLNISISTFNQNNKTFLLFSVLDLTEMTLNLQALQLAENKYRKLVNSIPDAVVLVDNKNQIADCNEAFKKLFRLEEKDLVGHNLFEIISKYLDLPETMKVELKDKMHKTLVLGDMSTLPNLKYGRLKFEDGKTVHFVKSIFKVTFDEKSHYMGAVIKDITQQHNLIEQLKEANTQLDKKVLERTRELEEALRNAEEANQKLKEEIEERKKLEIALQKSKEMYQNFLDRIPVAVYRTNLDGEFLFANKALVHLLGCKSKEELFQTRAYVYYPKAEQRKTVLVEHQKSQDEYIKAEYEIIRKDGKHLIVQDYGRTLYDPETTQQIFEGVIIDITDEIKYKNELALSEKRFRSLFEGISEIVLKVSFDGKIIEVSPSVSNILGYTPEEFVGFDFKKMFARSVFFDSIINLIKDKGKVHQILLELISKDGTVRYLNGDFLLSENDTINAFLRDVTEEYENKNFMSAIFSIFRTFSEENNIYLIAENIQKALGYLIPVPNFLFAIKDENENRLNVVLHHDRYGTRLKYIDLAQNSNPIVKVFHNQKTEIFDNEVLNNLFGNPKYPDPTELVVLPLSTYRNQIGIIAIYTYNQSQLLTKTKIYYLNIIAEQISLGLERKLLADKLNLQLKLFDTLIESIPYPIFYRDLVTGKYRYCNESFARFAEKPKSEIVGKKIEDTLLSDIVEILKQKDEEIKSTGKMQTFEIKKAYPNGIEQTFLSIRSPIKFEELNEIAVVGILIDLTERINYERQLQIALNFNKLILETAPVGIITLDKESKVTFWNQKAEELTGYSASEVVGKKPPFCDTQPCIEEFLTSDSKKSHTIEQTITRKDGTEIIIQRTIAPLYDFEGEINGAIISFDDITTRKESEKKLHYLADVNSRLASVANFVLKVADKATLFDSIFPIALQISGAQEMLFTEIGDKGGIPTIELIEIIGLDQKKTFNVTIPLEKFVNSYLGKVYTEREFLVVENALPERLINGLEHLATKNLAFFPLNQMEKIVGIMVFSLTGKTFTEEIISVLNQLSMILSANLERIFFQNELMNTLQKQMEINELRSNFISMISHEYKTPLQAVLMSAEILQRHYERLTDEQRNMQFRRIAKAIQDMATMLDNVILYNRLSRASERINFETVKVKPFFEGIIRDFELYYHDKAKIVCKTKFKTQEAKVEQQLLHLIFSNLISNAIKYSKSDPVVEIEVEVKKDLIKLVFADKGIGIPEEELPLIFEPFYRGKNTKLIAGTGLGLSIVKNSVELLGGKINVESKLNEGTKFTIELPIP